MTALMQSFNYVATRTLASVVNFKHEHWAQNLHYYYSWIGLHYCVYEYVIKQNNEPLIKTKS